MPFVSRLSRPPSLSLSPSIYLSTCISLSLSLVHGATEVRWCASRAAGCHSHQLSSLAEKLIKINLFIPPLDNTPSCAANAVQRGHARYMLGACTEPPKKEKYYSTPASNRKEIKKKQLILAYDWLSICFLCCRRYQNRVHHYRIQSSKGKFCVPVCCVLAFQEVQRRPGKRTEVCEKGANAGPLQVL